ncbi:hypothetical protein FA13DRAFT_1714382 [Coprinellus micaceus]|uniref:Uncharacterized protein n=1 Tax=Coprinellus micaceus TaxID=71717 RepID=A0A4Y7SS87_COPMI|nr:hypothetical protein FA13DRAFT_1714382 [Coprinellus micaceus]
MPVSGSEVEKALSIGGKGGQREEAKREPGQGGEGKGKAAPSIDDGPRINHGSSLLAVGAVGALETVDEGPLRELDGWQRCPEMWAPPFDQGEQESVLPHPHHPTTSQSPSGNRVRKYGSANVHELSNVLMHYHLAASSLRGATCPADGLLRLS